MIIILQELLAMENLKKLQYKAVLQEISKFTKWSGRWSTLE